MALLLFTYFLEIGQNNYVEMYNEMTLEMSDFSLKVSGLPDERHYSEENIKYRDEALRCLIVTHFQTIIQNQLKLEKVKNAFKSGFAGKLGLTLRLGKGAIGTK